MTQIESSIAADVRITAVAILSKKELMAPVLIPLKHLGRLLLLTVQIIGRKFNPGALSHIGSLGTLTAYRSLLAFGAW
jgi:hypothetical protein